MSAFACHSNAVPYLNIVVLFAEAPWSFNSAPFAWYCIASCLIRSVLLSAHTISSTPAKGSTASQPISEPSGRTSGPAGLAIGSTSGSLGVLGTVGSILVLSSPSVKSITKISSSLPARSSPSTGTAPGFSSIISTFSSSDQVSVSVGSFCSGSCVVLPVCSIAEPCSSGS
ncbi:hypothetical protein IJU97_00780 [bacterium]|nr:hypothetical protein [bacterium]